MFIGTLISFLFAMQGNPALVASEGNWRCYRLADSCRMEVVFYPDSARCDSALVVRTTCVPVCNSVALVCDNNGQVLRRIEAPEQMVLPYATIHPDGQLLWEDHTDALLDDEEKKQ